MTRRARTCRRRLSIWSWAETGWGRCGKYRELTGAGVEEAQEAIAKL